MSYLDECDCSCHRQEGVYHIAACCEICPACRKRIKFQSEKHIAACKEQYIKKLEKIFVRELTEEEKKALFE